MKYMHIGRLSTKILFVVLAISMKMEPSGLRKKKVPAETMPTIRSSNRNVLTMLGSSKEPISKCRHLPPMFAEQSRSTSFLRVIGPVRGNWTALVTQ